MVVNQETFDLIPKVPESVATVTVEGTNPEDLFTRGTAIYVNFGKKKTNSVVEYAFDIVFKDPENKFKAKKLNTDCGCTAASTLLTKPDGNIELVLRYNSKRIGFQDKGDFRKGVSIDTDKGKINFVLLISEQK